MRSLRRAPAHRLSSAISLPRRARFHWLTAKRSAILQTSPVHMGRCGDMEAIVEHLMARMVRIGTD